MSREIDERLVAMRFDNQQFEEGVKESLASLAALREGLDLDGAADSFNDVYKASEKYLKFDGPTKSANSFRDSLTRIGQVGKTIFNGFTAPLKAVGNVVNGLYKDMTRLFGLDIAYNLEQSAIKTLRAFTTDPLSTGFQEYETKIDSLKTIMTSTVETYTNKLKEQYAEDLLLAEKERDAEIKAANERYKADKKALEAEAKRSKMSEKEKATQLAILKAQKDEAEVAARERYAINKGQLTTYDEDEHRKAVKKNIEELNAYADKTIYNFQEMMKALPTLTNVGVELDAATSMVKGMSNLAAYAGKGSTEATFALRNLGQAMSLGYFQLIDWKTMEQQGLNTRDFVKTAIQMGLKTGTLIEKNGKVYAQDMIEKYDKAMSEGQAAAAKKKKSSDQSEILRKAKEKAEGYLEEVTVDNFRETLKYQWFDKKTIEQAFKVFSGDLTEADLIGMGFDPEKDSGLISWFLKVGNDAMTAATQVRSFTKMMDALKEAAQSGWAQSYEYIFGDDKEATKFWTGINNALSEVIGNASEKRNALLKDWSEQTVELETGDSGLFPTIDGKGEKSKLISTRDALMVGINSIIAAFDLLRKAVGNAWENVFGKIDGKMLANLTKRFSDFASNFTKKGIRDNLPRITKALEGFFAVLKVVFGTAKEVFTWVGDKVSPIFKWLFDAILKLGEFLGTKLKGAKNLKDVFDIFKSSASGGAKTAIDWFASIPEKISSKWQSFKEWYNGSTLKTVVDNIWSSILGFFKAPDDAEDGKSGFDRLVEWLIGAYGTLKTKWKEIIDWWNNPDNKLHGVVDNIWSGIISFFKAPEGSDGGQSGLEGAVTWIQGVWDSIKNWTGWNEISSFVSESGIGGKVQAGLSKLLETIANLLNPNTVVAPKALKPIDRTKLIASGGMSDVSYVDFDEKDSIITKFMNFIGRMKADWETAKANIDALIKDIPAKIDSLRSTLSKFFGGDGEDSWDSIFDSAVDDAKGLGQVKLLFSGASALSGLGSLLRGAGSFSKNLGKSAKELSKKHVPLGEVFGEFFKRLSTPFATFFDPKNKRSIGEWISNFKPFGDVTSNYANTTKKIKNVAIAILEFAGAIWIMIDAVSKIAELTKDTEVDWGMTTAVIGGLATIVTAFEFIGSMTEGKVTGLLSFAIVIETLLLAVKQIASMGKSGVDFDDALTILAKLTALISAFEFISKLSDIGYAGVNIGTKGKSTGLLGFVIAIEGLILAIKQIAEIGATTTFDNVLGVLDHLVILIGSFEAISKLSGLNSFDGSSILFAGKSTGLIGFVIAVEGMIDSIRRIAELQKNGIPIDSSIQIIDKLAFLIGKFELVSKLSKIDFGTFGSSFSFGLSGKASGLLGFTFAIRELINSVGKIANSDAGLDKMNAAVNILDKLGWIIDKFQIFTGLKGLALGSVSKLNSKGKLLSPNGSSGIIGFVLAISGLVYDLSVLSNIDSAKAEKAADILEKMSNMINVFVGIDTLRQGATALTGFSGMSGAATNVGKTIDFLAMEGFVGSIILLVDKIIAVSKDSELDTTKVNDIVPVFDTLGTIITKITSSVGVFELLNSLAGKFGSSGGSGWATGAKAAVNLLEFVGIAGAALWGIGAALKAAGVTDDQLEDVASTIHSLTPVVTAITGELGALIGGFAGGTVAGFEGEKMNVATAGIDEAVTNLANVTEEDLAKLQTSISALNAINETLPNKTLWEAFTGSKMENFAKGMEQLGNGFSKFYLGISTVTDWTAFETAVEALKSVVTLGTLVTEYATESLQYGDAAYDLLHFFGVLSGVDSVGFNMTPGDIDSYTTIESIWNSFGANLAGSLIAGVKSKAEELSTIITSMVDTNPVITPVLDLEKFNQDAAGMWSVLPVGISYNLAGANVNNTTTVDLEIVKELIEQHAADIDKINQTMADGLTFIGTMLGSISLNMDGQKVGGIVTPYVDANIAVELARYLRQNGLVP